MAKGVLIIILLLVVLVAIFSVVFKSSPEIVNKIPGFDNFDKERRESKGPRDSGSGFFGGGPGEVLSDDSSKKLDIVSIFTGCEDFQISYSAEDFAKTSNCNQNSSGFCTDRTVNCSVDIRNFDNEVSGTFGIDFVFFELGFESNILDETSSSFNINAGENNLFEGITNFVSQGEDGIANKDLSCSYVTIEIPRKEICE